jgi:YebC/PmpR family DNA-binding regulatory protein
MSGHSKWSKVKHQKATTDVVKAKAFTQATHGIILAVKGGGGIGDPNLNFHLRLAIEKARQVNMPKENIERAIDKAKGEGGADIQEIMYEAFGPGGVAMLIAASTDNKQRTVSALKNVLEHTGGVLAGPGSVSYLFTKCGILTVPKKVSYDTLYELALTFGADNIEEMEDLYEIYTALSQFRNLKEGIEKAGIEIDNAEIIMKPTTSVSLDADKYDQLMHLLHQIEELEDIVKVYTNVYE